MMAGNMVWLADALRAGGCRVHEHSGWKTRGHGNMGRIEGVLAHHTAGSGTERDIPVVRDGRAGLAGPLAQLALAPDGTYHVLASGQAWHAGSGGPWGPVPRNGGNSRLIGIEGVSRGTRDDWTDAQREMYPLGVAALLRHLRLGGDRLLGHKEWTSRKIDPAYWDMNQFRAQVTRLLAGAPAGQPDALAASRRRTFLLLND